MNKKIVFFLWIIIIAICFTVNLCFVEYNVKMHKSVGVAELILALITGVVIIVIHFVKKIDVFWYLIPLMYAFSGVVLGYVASFIPCCSGG